MEQNIIYPLFNKDREKYSISINEIPRIKKIYNDILENKNEVLSLAFERFNNAITKTNNEKNSFIDFVTILESIVLNNNNQELSFRFALYISFILSNKLKNPVKFKDVKTIYNVRSQLVHGGKSKDYNKTMYKKLEQYTKVILLWILDNGLISDKDCKEMILHHLKIN